MAPLPVDIADDPKCTVGKQAPDRILVRTASLDDEAKEKLSQVTREIVNIAKALEHNRLLRDKPQEGIEHADNIYTTFLSTDQTTEKTVQRQVRTHVDRRPAAAWAVSPEPHAQVAPFAPYAAGNGQHTIRRPPEGRRPRARQSCTESDAQPVY